MADCSNFLCTNIFVVQVVLLHQQLQALMTVQINQRYIEWSLVNPMVVGDPGNHKPIEKYAYEIRGQVRREYALRGPTQPRNLSFACKWKSDQW